MFRVEHKPKEANPASHPWCVLRTGPVYWYKEEVPAQTYATARNEGLTHEEAEIRVRALPNPEFAEVAPI